MASPHYGSLSKVMILLLWPAWFLYSSLSMICLLSLSCFCFYVSTLLELKQASSEYLICARHSASLFHIHHLVEYSQLFGELVIITLLINEETEYQVVLNDFSISLANGGAGFKPVFISMSL